MIIPQRWEESQIFKRDVKCSKCAADSGQCSTLQNQAHSNIFTYSNKTPN